jgi:hypothetical protein
MIESRPQLHTLLAAFFSLPQNGIGFPCGPRVQERELGLEQG